MQFLHDNLPGVACPVFHNLSNGETSMTKQPSRLLLALLREHRHTPSWVWLRRADNWRLYYALY